MDAATPKTADEHSHIALGSFMVIDRLLGPKTRPGCDPAVAAAMRCTSERRVSACVGSSDTSRPGTRASARSRYATCSFHRPSFASRSAAANSASS